jgi:hypothetical protein
MFSFAAVVVKWDKLESHLNSFTTLKKIYFLAITPD